MENRLVKHANGVISSYRESILEIINDSTKDDETKLFLINNLPEVSITVDDLLKKRRVRNTIHDSERCCAYRATGERCTRKKKDGSELCGTHIKGTPHGCINVTSVTKEEQNLSKITVETLDVNGIVYYVDKESNAYSSTDIMKNMINPQVIGKVTRDTNGSLYIRSV